MLSSPGQPWNWYGMNPGIYGKKPWKILESSGILVSNLAGNPDLGRVERRVLWLSWVEKNECNFADQP